MDRKSQSLFILPKENLGQNPLMKKSTFDNYIKFKITKTTLNPISMVSFTQATQTQWDIIWIQSYIIGKYKTTRPKQEVVGPFKLYRRNQSINVSQSPSFQKLFEKKTREYPTLTPTNISIRQNQWYKDGWTL